LPVPALQVPVVHMPVMPEQSLAVPAQLPALHASPVVHMSPSSQLAVLGDHADVLLVGLQI
jgi:hypothetical protein